MAYDITDYTTNGTNIDLSNKRVFTWGDGGNKAYSTGRTTVDGFIFAQIKEYDVGTPYDITTLTEFQSRTFSSQNHVSNDIFWKPDGTKYWIARDDRRKGVTEYVPENPWQADVRLGTRKEFSSQFEPVYGVAWKNDGTKIFINAGGGTVEEYSVSTAWDLSSSVSLNGSHTFVNSDSGLRFDDDGNRLWLITGSNVHQYDLGTAWDITSSVTETATVPTPDVFGDYYHIQWNGTGDRFTVSVGRNVYEYEPAVVEKVSGALGLSSTVSTDLKTLTGQITKTTDFVQGAEVNVFRESDNKFIGYDTTDVNGNYSISIGPATGGDTLIVAVDYVENGKYYEDVKSIVYQGQ